MNEQKWVSISRASEHFGVAQSTLRRWDEQNKISVRRTKNGQRRFLLQEETNEEKKLKICYCRVSSSHQKNDKYNKIISNYNDDIESDSESETDTESPSPHNNVMTDTQNNVSSYELPYVLEDSSLVRDMDDQLLFGKCVPQVSKYDKSGEYIDDKDLLNFHLAGTEKDISVETSSSSSNFAYEKIQTNYSSGFGKKVTITIPRTGDLIYNPYRIQLPPAPSMEYTSEMITQIAERTTRSSSYRDDNFPSSYTNTYISNILQNLYTIKLTKNNIKSYKNINCSICMNTFNKHNEIAITACNHSFHYDCMKNWTESHSFNKKCPMCRESLTNVHPKAYEQHEEINKQETIKQNKEKENYAEAQLQKMFKEEKKKKKIERKAKKKEWLHQK